MSLAGGPNARASGGPVAGQGPGHFHIFFQFDLIHSQRTNAALLFLSSPLFLFLFFKLNLN